jgi:hypothetical protein
LRKNRYLLEFHTREFLDGCCLANKSAVCRKWWKTHASYLDVGGEQATPERISEMISITLDRGVGISPLEIDGKINRMGRAWHDTILGTIKLDWLKSDLGAVFWLWSAHLLNVRKRGGPRVYEDELDRPWHPPDGHGIGALRTVPKGQDDEDEDEDDDEDDDDD